MSKQKQEVQKIVTKVSAQPVHSPFFTPSPVQRALLDADKVPIKRTQSASTENLQE